VSVLFPLLAPATDPGTDMRTLVDAGVYDIRRVSVGPRQPHGPGRQDGDACVLVLDGSVVFTVDGRPHAVAAGELLWVKAEATRGFIGGDEGAVLLAIHLPRGRGHERQGRSDIGAEDQAVINKVTAHHAEMSAKLESLAAAVAQPGDVAPLASSLSSLLEYLRREVLPHAAAEEETFYADARDTAGGAALVDALVMEHEELRAGAQVLADIYDSCTASVPGNGEGMLRTQGDVRTRAAAQAAAIAALFHIHARKENEIVLPALVAAGRPLRPLLSHMERAFSVARGTT
jgi:quercetin dioxygenase-like cupin family protein/hemerythrin-like domain-containing protein